MRFDHRKFLSGRTGFLTAGAVFVFALAAPVHLPSPGDLSIENAASAKSMRSHSRSSMSQDASGCDATCLNNQQLQGMSGGMSGSGMSGGGMSGGNTSGASMSGSSMGSGGMSSGGMSGGGTYGSGMSGSDMSGSGMSGGGMSGGGMSGGMGGGSGRTTY